MWSATTPGTFTVDRKHLTVSTAYGKKTAEVDARVRYKVLAHELLKQLVQEEKARKESTIRRAGLDCLPTCCPAPRNAASPRTSGWW